MKNPENSTAQIGIVGYGVSIPKRRIDRKVIATAHRWFNPGLMGAAKGRRSQCRWDEDVITLATAAIRDAVPTDRIDTVQDLFLSSTTLPFADRQNATVVAEACGMSSEIRTLDNTGSLRAGTSALITALEKASTGVKICVAADSRRAKPGSLDELSFGHGAAAIAIGSDTIIAEFIGSHSVSDDFVDHYRAAHSPFDYQWEARWARDEGTTKTLPGAVSALLGKVGLETKDISHVVIPAVSQRDAARLAKVSGLSDQAVIAPPELECGHLGAAQSGLVLSRALDAAQPGQYILVAGIGQGCDVLLFRTTDHLLEYRDRKRAEDAIGSGIEDDNYFRFLAFEGTLEMEAGIRAEADLKTAHSVAYRAHDQLTGLHAGRCGACGTVQFPKERKCVNPDCHEIDQMQPYPLADKPAKVVSFTRDALAYHPDPPSVYGMIAFEGGGRLMIEFVEWDDTPLTVGAPVRLVFRIKDIDHHRGYRRYFWKAIPA